MFVKTWHYRYYSMPKTGFNLGNTEIPLTGMLAEFREALRAEIEVARRNAVNTAVPLGTSRGFRWRAAALPDLWFRDHGI